MNPDEATPAPLHVAVAGAGMAGLSCATALLRAGHRVSLFDKSRAPSGRMSTRRGEGWLCDHGAQYFTARDPAFRAQVARWESAGVAAPWQPRLAVLGGSPSQQGSGGGMVERFVGVPRMTSPAASLAKDLSVRCGTTVSALLPGPWGWRLSCLEQRAPLGDFDGVVLALPAPQAAPLLQAVAPAMAMLASQAMQACWAVMLRFDTPLDLPFDAAFVNDGPLRWLARDSSKPGRGSEETWLLHASAPWSEAHLELDGEVVAELLIEAFMHLGGARPRASSAHRWRYAIASPALDLGCAWQAGAGLGLCGDWLHGGAVEGAWLSGLALAGKIIASGKAQLG